MKSRSDTMFFWDGERRIDMVLAYEDDDDDAEDEEEEEEEEEGAERDEQTRAQKREQFEQNLVEQGLELELEEAKVSEIS